MELQYLLNQLESINNATNNYNLSLYWYEKQSLEKAESYARNAVYLDENLPEALDILSLILFDKSKNSEKNEEKRKMKEAFSFADRAYELKPELEDNYPFGVSPIKRRLAEIESK